MEYRNVREIFPGIGCAWTNADGKATAEYYGVADRESNTPVNRDTIFPACSISKFITAICVMKLHEQGAIDIDHPVNYYLHQYPHFLPYTLHSTINSNQLHLKKPYLCLEITIV